MSTICDGELCSRHVPTHVVARQFGFIAVSRYGTEREFCSTRCLNKWIEDETASDERLDEISRNCPDCPEGSHA